MTPTNRTQPATVHLHKHVLDLAFYFSGSKIAAVPAGDPGEVHPHFQSATPDATNHPPCIAGTHNIKTPIQTASMLACSSKPRHTTARDMLTRPTETEGSFREPLDWRLVEAWTKHRIISWICFHASLILSTMLGIQIHSMECGIRNRCDWNGARGMWEYYDICASVQSRR